MKWFVPLSPFAQVLVVAVLIVLVVGVSFLAMQADTKVPLPAYSIPCEIVSSGEAVVVTLAGPQGPMEVRPLPSSAPCDGCLVVDSEGLTRRARFELVWTDDELPAQLPNEGEETPR